MRQYVSPHHLQITDGGLLSDNVRLRSLEPARSGVLPEVSISLVVPDVGAAGEGSAVDLDESVHNVACGGYVEAVPSQERRGNLVGHYGDDVLPCAVVKNLVPEKAADAVAGTFLGQVEEGAE